MDPALGRVLDAVPKEYLGVAIIVVAIIWAWSKFVRPVLKQTVPAKGSTNGESATLHQKLDENTRLLLDQASSIEHIRHDQAGIREDMRLMAQRVDGLERRRSERQRNGK
jgi:hypothetical protein